jgi:hypothetical protein
MPQYNMEDDIIIFGISMMLMVIPIAGSDMNLYVPFRQTKLIHDYCIPKVGTVITVDSPGVDYVDQLVFGGGQLLSHHLLPY